MSNKTENLKLNIEYTDNQTFRNVLDGTDENFEIIDPILEKLITILEEVNEDFSKSIDLEN